MKANEVRKTLKNLGYNEIVYDDIKYYLRANNMKLNEITNISYHDDFHCLLEVNNEIIGVI